MHGGIYMFQFYHVVDMNRILDMSPWTFNNQALLMEKLGDFQHPFDVLLNHMYMWVKVFGLKFGFKYDKVVHRLGDMLGTFVEADPDNYEKWECE